MNPLAKNSIRIAAGAIVLIALAAHGWGAAPDAPAKIERIRLLVLNDALNDSETARLARKMQNTFAIGVQSAKRNVPLESAFDPSRRQFKAEALLHMDALFKPQKDGDYIIAFVPEDVYSEGTRFVFSMTDPSLRTVFGLARLRIPSGAASMSADTTVDRLYTLLLRRVGIMVEPVPSECGPMAFSNSLQELDSVAPVYCPADAEFLKAHHYLK